MTKNSEEFNNIQYPLFAGIDFNSDPQDINPAKLTFGSQNAICNVKRGSIQLRPGFGRVTGDLFSIPPSIIPELNSVYIPGLGWQNSYDNTFSVIATPNNNLELDINGNLAISFTTYGGSSLGITNYSWNFEYAGSPTINQTGTSISVTYTYTTPGTKICRVWGVGTDGNEYAAIVSINIGAYQAPVTPGSNTLIPLPIVFLDPPIPPGGQPPDPPVPPGGGGGGGKGGGGGSGGGKGENGRKKKKKKKNVQLPIPELGLVIRDYPKTIVNGQGFKLSVVAINVHSGLGHSLPDSTHGADVVVDMVEGRGSLPKMPLTLTFTGSAVKYYPGIVYNMPSDLIHDTFKIQASLVSDGTIRSPVYTLRAYRAYLDFVLSTSSVAEGTEFTFTVTVRSGWGGVFADWDRIISYKAYLVSPKGASYSIDSGNADTFVLGTSNAVPVTISDIGDKPIVIAFDGLEPHFASNKPEITVYPANGYLEIVVPDTIYNKTPFTMTLQAKDNTGADDTTNHNNEAYSINAVDESGNSILLNGSATLNGTLNATGGDSVSVTYSSSTSLGNSGIFNGTAGTIAGETTAALSNAYEFDITSTDYQLETGVAQNVTITAKAGGSTMTGYNGAVDFSLFAVDGNSDTSAATINLSSVTLTNGVGVGSLTVTDVSLPSKTDITFAATDNTSDVDESASRRDFVCFVSSNYAIVSGTINGFSSGGEPTAAAAITACDNDTTLSTVSGYWSSDGLDSNRLYGAGRQVVPIFASNQTITYVGIQLVRAYFQGWDIANNQGITTPGFTYTIRASTTPFTNGADAMAATSVFSVPIGGVTTTHGGWTVATIDGATIHDISSSVLNLGGDNLIFYLSATVNEGVELSNTRLVYYADFITYIAW